MKNILSVLTNQFVMIGIIVVLLILFWNSCQTNKELKATYKQNTEAFKKEIDVTTNKNGELQYSVETWQGKASDLKEYSKELADELENVKKSKVKIITKTVIKYSPPDTVEIDNRLESLGDGSYALNWSYANEDSSRVLVGKSQFKAGLDTINLTLNITPGQTFIIKDELGIVLIVGVKKNKQTGFDEIFVTPKTPGITISELEGAILEKDKKTKLSIGIIGGYGVGMGQNSTLRLTPFIGIGLTKPIISF